MKRREVTDKFSHKSKQHETIQIATYEEPSNIVIIELTVKKVFNLLPKHSLKMSNMFFCLKQTYRGRVKKEGLKSVSVKKKSLSPKDLNKVCFNIDPGDNN